MTYKRFIFETVKIIEPDNSERIANVITDKEKCFSYEIFELEHILNELDDRIKRLESSYLKLAEECISESRRAEKLKNDNEELGISIKLYDNDVSRLLEENKQLKDELEKIKLLNKSLGMHLT